MVNRLAEKLGEKPRDHFGDEKESDEIDGIEAIVKSSGTTLPTSVTAEQEISKSNEQYIDKYTSNEQYKNVWSG